MREIKNKRNNINVNSSSDSLIVKQTSGLKRHHSQVPSNLSSNSSNNFPVNNKRKKFSNNTESNDSNIESAIESISNNLSKKQINYDADAIIYARISSKNQSFGTSLDSQLDICRKYCKENNFKILCEVSEIVSARKMEKQEKLLELLNSNSDFNLVVLEPSRISRNIADFINQLDTVKQNKIVLHFVQDNLVSSNSIDFKKIIAGIYDGELESETLSKRMKRSVEKRKVNGTFYPSVPPFGYDYNNESKDGKIIKNLVENEKEQQLIHLINNLYWGSKISNIESQLKNITGEKHDLYFPQYDEPAEEIKYGNMKLIDIANFLNSIPISRRNRDWNSNSVKQVIDM